MTVDLGLRPIFLALEVMAYLEEKTLSHRMTVSLSKGAFKTNVKKCIPDALLVHAKVDDAFAEAVVLPWFKKWKERNNIPEYKLTKELPSGHTKGVLTLVIPISESDSKDIARVLNWGIEYSYPQIKSAKTPIRVR